MELEKYCCEHGFIFHKGRTTTGKITYWTFNQTNTDGHNCFSIKIYPETHQIKITNKTGYYKGCVLSINHLHDIFHTMQIKEVDITNPQQVKETKKQYMKLRMKITQKVANQIKEHFGFRYEKCVDLAMRGKWWSIQSYSKIALLDIPTTAKEIIEDIE